MADSAVLAEVRAIVAGEGVYRRRTSFEPLLAPLVVGRVTAGMVPKACSVGRAITRGDPRHGWPLLGLSYAQALAPRLDEITAPGAIATFPDLVLFVDESLVTISAAFTSPKVMARWNFRQREPHESLLPSAHLGVSPDPTALVLGLERLDTQQRDAAIPLLLARIDAHEVDRRVLIDSLVAPYSSDYATIAREAFTLLDAHVPAWYWTTLAAHLGVFVRGQIDDINAGILPGVWAEHFRQLVANASEIDVGEVPVVAHPHGARLVELLPQLAADEAARVAGEVLDGIESQWEGDISAEVPAVAPPPVAYEHDVSAPSYPAYAPETIAPVNVPYPKTLRPSPAAAPPYYDKPSTGSRRRWRDVFRPYRREPMTTSDPPEMEPPRPLQKAKPPWEIIAEHLPPQTAEPVAPEDAPDAPARSLHADITAMASEGQDEAPVRQSFARGRAHRVEIWIGRPEPAKPTTVMASLHFAEAALVHTGDTALLDVTLAHGRDSTTRQITLPKDTARSSSRAQFELFVPDNESRLIATVTVEQNSRVIQQAVLVGDVADTPDGGVGAPIELIVQMSARPIDDTTSVMHFDASVTTPAADAPAVIKVGDVARVPQPWDDGLRTEIKTIGDKLFATAKGQAGQLATEDNWPKLIGFLALHGKRLYSWLMAHDYDGLAPANTIQLTDADPSRPLPIELVYDGPGPALDAKPCAGWDESLTTGTCLWCQTTEPDEHVICPLRFWGLSKVIERQAGHVTEVATAVKPLSSALFAASANVRDEDFEATIDSLKAACAVAPATATTWAEVKDAVRTQKPSLIVLMPHQAFDADNMIDLLEIGADNALPAGQVTAEHVKAADAGSPLVLLLGCKTADASVSYLNFVAEFREKGAALVIGTTATVLGRDVAPIAQRIVAELARVAESDEKPQTVGSLLLKSRRQMIAEQNAAAFALVAFGDADLAVSGV